jgi:hypothetical protein
MLQRTTTTANGRRSPSDPAAETAYRFGAPPGLVGWPAGLDPAQIWLGPARSGLPFLSSFSFLCLIQMLIMCCALNRFKNALSLRKL